MSVIQSFYSLSYGGFASLFLRYQFLSLHQGFVTNDDEPSHSELLLKISNKYILNMKSNQILTLTYSERSPAINIKLLIE